MEAVEICNFSISSLVIPFGVHWSYDNHISIIGEKGVHVFELIPSPLSPHASIKFSKTFIYASDVLPALAFAKETETLLWKMKHEELYSLLMETALTPKIEGALDIIPKIVNVAWSPQNLLHPSKCILAIVTTAGAIEFLHKVSNSWFSLYNLSSCWLKSVQNDITQSLKNCDSERTGYTVIKRCMRQLQGCAMCWSHLYKNPENHFAYFVAAFRNSDLTIWKVPRITDFVKPFAPELISKVNLETDEKINVLHWIDANLNNSIIVVGFFDGRICGLKYENDGRSLKYKQKENYYEYADRIPISSVHLISKTESNIKVLVTKGSFLLLLKLDSAGVLQSTQHLQMEGFTITGLTTIRCEQVLIITQDNTMVVLDTKEECLKVLPIKYNVPRTRTQFLGLAHSPNYSMIVNISAPNSTFDHLVLREPSTVHILSLEYEGWNSLAVLDENKDAAFGQLWECLEVLRVKAIKSAWPAMILPSPPESTESLSLFDLRKLLWISVLSRVCTEKQITPGRINIIYEMSEMRSAIFIHSAAAYLTLLKEKTSLTEEHKLSITLLKMYLDVYLAGEDDEESPLSRHVKEALNAVSHLSSARVEMCNLCGTPITEVPWSVTECSFGHKLPRCGLTLLQITTSRYRCCPICGEIFHLCIDEVYEEVRCPFCDVPALLDNRVIDIKTSGFCTRNLSKPQLPGTKSQHTDQSIAEDCLKE